LLHGALCYQRGEGGNVLWNHFIHVLAGVLGASIFLWSSQGTIAAAILAAVVQGIDAVRMYFYHKRLILQSPSGIKEERMKAFEEGAIYKLAQIYIVKVAWYGFVTLLVAAVARSFGA